MPPCYAQHSAVTTNGVGPYYSTKATHSAAIRSCSDPKPPALRPPSARNSTTDLAGGLLIKKRPLLYSECFFMHHYQLLLSVISEARVYSKPPDLLALTNLNTKNPTAPRIPAPTIDITTMSTIFHSGYGLVPWRYIRIFSTEKSLIRSIFIT
jgi:hypothetical protein